MQQRYWLYLVTFMIFFSVLYGVTYQQYRHFNVDDPRGASDSLSYIRMAHNNHDAIPAFFRYRFLVPLAAHWVSVPLSHFIDDIGELDKLSFYIVNFLLSLSTSILLFLILNELKFDIYLSLLGVIIFISSRITILVTGTPLVDSLFYLSMLVIIFLILREKGLLLALCLPILCLSKELILPFLFLPLLSNIRRSRCYILSLLISLFVLFCSRRIIDSLYADSTSFFSVLHWYTEQVLHNTSYLFTLRGLHDFQNGFSLFLFLSMAGAYINHKFKLYQIPLYFHLLLPISLVFVVLSGSIGRMVFTSFPVIIPYALICISYVYQHCYLRDRSIS